MEEKTFLDHINNILTEKDQRIAYLEEELVDKELLERAVRACNRQNNEFADMIKKLVSEKEELKQQLTEKEDEIKQLNNRILLSQSQAPKEQILNILGSKCIQYNTDQYKIDFAVERLEKVKELLDGYKWFQGDNKYSFVNDYAVDWSDVVKIFDNQIKAIKGGK